MCPLFSLSLSLSLYIEEPPVPHWRVRHLLTTHFCLLSLSILLVHTITTPCSWKLSSSDHMRLARPNKSTLFQTPIINALETLIHLVWSILEHLSFSLFSQTMYGINTKSSWLRPPCPSFHNTPLIDITPVAFTGFEADLLVIATCDYENPCILLLHLLMVLGLTNLTYCLAALVETTHCVHHESDKVFKVLGNNLVCIPGCWHANQFVHVFCKDLVYIQALDLLFLPVSTRTSFYRTWC